MSSTKRKERRQRERLATAEGERDAAREQLAATRSELERISNEHAALMARIENHLSEFAAVTADNATLRTELSEARALVLELTRENESLHREYKDTAKTKRRLREAKEQLRVANSRISQMQEAMRA